MTWMKIVGTAVKAGGQLQQAYSQASMSDAQKDQFLMSAQANRWRAGTIYQQGNRNEESQRREADIRMGQARAMAAQSGTGMDGSAVDVIQQSASNAELDALNIRYESDLAARGALAQADQDVFGARIKKREAHNLRVGGIMSAANTVFGSMASNYAGSGK